MHSRVFERKKHKTQFRRFYFKSILIWETRKKAAQLKMYLTEKIENCIYEWSGSGKKID